MFKLVVWSEMKTHRVLATTIQLKREGEVKKSLKIEKVRV